MLSGLCPRNGLLISGVVISHVLVILSFLSVSLSESGPRSPGTMKVSLIGENTNPSSLPKSLPINKTNASSSGERISSSPKDESSTLGGGKAGGHYEEGVAREVIHSPKPRYPLASRQLREQGLVIARLCVNEKGLVQEVGIAKSSGFEGLDRSALHALAQWRFAPTTTSSPQFFMQCFQTPIQFTLEG